MPFGYGNNYGNGGGILRWLIGAVIAIVGVLGYYRTTTRNPVTGEMQHVAMTPQQEMTLGLQSAPRMAAEMGGEVNPADPMAQLVSEVGRRILHNSDAARGPYTQNFHYHLLADDRTINAFALPGGQIFITRALLVRLQNEAQLAGVLGHETGHVIERHSAQQMAKGQLGQSIVTAIGIGSSGNRDSGMTATMIANTVNRMKQLSYSREDETQADTRGLQYMAQAGYDPRAMLGVMQILNDVTRQQSGHPPEMLQTHPHPEHRIETINAWLKQNMPNGVPGHLTTGRPLNRGRVGGGASVGGFTLPRSPGPAAPPRTAGKDQW